MEINGKTISKSFLSGRLCRPLFAVVIFFGLSATPCQAAVEAETDSGARSEHSGTENFFDKTIDTSSGTFTNAENFTSKEPSTTGLHVLGFNNLVRQSGNIFLAGNSGIGIRVDGVGNFIIVPQGTTIQASGAGGKGILISYGRDHRLNVAGNIFATSNAVEFNGGSNPVGVDEFNLSGRLTGNEHAIFIGNRAFVQDINVNAGAEIFGNVTSLSNSTTNFNINTDLNYGGKISGANLKLYVNGSTLNFFGAANVSSVEVGRGAKIFGGTFTAGNFVNHGTIGASSPETNLTINGNLISDGFLMRRSGGSKGFIVVNGNANIEGSTATTDSLLPNETATVLVADSITGNIVNPTGKPVPISAMLNATGEIVDNKLTVTTYEADNLGKMTSQEAETFSAMKNMFDNLDGNKQNEMRNFYNLEAPAAKQTLTQISSNDSAQIMSVAQQGTAVDKMIANRVTQIFMPEYIDVTVHPMNFGDGSGDDVTLNVKVPTGDENNFWLNFMKNWGSLRGGTDYHGSVIVGGYDRAIGDKWRAGIFATYGTIGYGAESSRATVHDTRFGLYAGYHNKASDLYLYLNGGQLRNSLHRGIYSLGLATNAKYNSRIVEIGGEYKYDLQPHRTWHVSPFVNFQASHLRQNSYNESGAGIYNQHVDARSNTYFAAQAGLDFKRYYRSGMLGFRFSVKHGFTGVDPELQINYEGDGSHSYRLRQKRDKTHFVFSLRGENEFARGWFIGGETEFQLGEHYKEITASVMLRRMW